MTCLRRHASLHDCLAALGTARVFAIETGGGRCYADERFRAGDAFLFGKDTLGLPAEVVDSWPAERLLRIPMRPGNRSVNLSNAVALVVFEAWRQLGFPGGG
jgi:tRNA (cytidine/uridine-2'-O-)-methyltransferase